MQVFAPGLSVAVIDGPPAPVPVSGTGHVTVYAPGLSVEVREPAAVPMPTIHEQDMSGDRVLHLNIWHETSRYERHQYLEIAYPTSPSSTKAFSFHVTNFPAGGGVVPLAGSSYSLKVDGIVRATTSVTPGVTTKGIFMVQVGQLSTGWHELDVVGPDGPSPKYFFYNHRNDGHVPSVMPVCSGSYEVAKDHQPHRWAWVPTTFVPTVVPLVPRECPPFDTALPGAELFRENLTARRSAKDSTGPTDMQPGGVPKRPNKNKDGIWSTFNIQFYHFDTLIAKYPRIPLLDGPRGVGTAAMLTHIQVDRHGGAYCLDPWRVLRISQDGTVTTRCGWRHKPVGGYWEETALADRTTMELVGDWSAIPPERHGMREAWGMAFDQDSLALDPNAPPQGGEQPHLNPVRLFVADTRNNRVLLLSFPRDSFTAPPVVTEFITGLSDPWDIVWVGGFLYISERTANRIIKCDAQTGALVGVVVQNNPALPGTGVINPQTRWHTTTGTLTERRAHDCITPEGLFYQDGWLYYSSVANQQVRRVNLSTGAIQVWCTFFVDNNSRFSKFCLSDGTFGPRGTVFMNTWSIKHHGFPEAKLPGNVAWNYMTVGNLPRGKGGKWLSMGYSAAAGVGNGRLFCASSGDGVVQLSKALPGDVVFDEAAYTRGEAYYAAKGYNIVFGGGGGAMGYHGFALPWGENADLDYYMKVWGH
jgi:hypothetical protein